VINHLQRCPAVLMMLILLQPTISGLCNYRLDLGTVADCYLSTVLLQRVGSGALRTASGVSSGSDGSNSRYLVMPQPVLVPRLGSTDEEG
jgi:hypothetical protein